MSAPPIILLLHRLLRVDDHPALRAACDTGRSVIPLYVHDDTSPGAWAPGGASRWWLHHSLMALAEDLEARGAPLMVRRGETVETVTELAGEAGASGVYLTRGHEPWVREMEVRLNTSLSRRGVEVKRFTGRLLADPDTVRTKSGDVYKVYTPFWRALRSCPIRTPVDPPSRIQAFEPALVTLSVADLGLLPTRPDWAGGLRDAWIPGPAGANARIARFIETALAGYDELRNRPDLEGTSKLSPHLHFGEVSVARLWHGIVARLEADGRGPTGAETFLKELVWREFSYHLLHHFPSLPEHPFRDAFRAFPWREDHSALAAWQTGLTGYPIVDAGMRELWHTGWMHNRVRMIVGSFLAKNLLLPWQAGEAWFWDCLVDADLASNAASWQWVSGSGADAAPYFRIFNPVTQGERYDPHGAYVRRWVPELARLPTQFIHAPWLAAKNVLLEAGVDLGSTYPAPIVDHKQTRTRALEAYEVVKSAR